MVGDYPFDQQAKDFLKAEFIYASKLKAKLENGDITQEYYDSNIWLASQQLQSPYAGFVNEFITAVNEEDLVWLGNQLGEDVKQLGQEVGSAVGKVVGSVVSGVSSGLASGVASSLGVSGWITVLLGLVVIYFVVKHEV